MTHNTGRTPTTVRWEDTDGSWWIISWDPDLGRYDATKITHAEAGEERIVDDVGFGDRRITTVEELAAQMNRTLPPEVVHDLEHPASVPTQLAMTPVVEATERPMGSRYRIDQGDGTWWELGWDKPLGTFYATRFLDDGELGHKVVEDYGNGFSEICTIAGLGQIIGQAIPPGISHELAADAAAHPFTVTPRFLPSDPMPVITPDPSDGSARAAELARWEARLRAQQAELEAFAASLTGQNRVEPLWALPSEPVTLALQMLNRDMGGESDLATFAGRLGLSSALAADLASGRSFALDIDRISQVCEALRCSPYDLWGPDLAQRILHAYGPERWPSHIEPLADGRERPSSLGEFRRRQLDADHTAHVTTVSPPTPPLAVADAPAPAEPVSNPDERPPKVVAVCYRTMGALAERSDGEIREVDPDSAARLAGVEAYHFKFRQVTEPRDVFLYPPTGIGEPAPAGHDADPLLANTAESFRNLPWLPQVDLVRFVAEDGRQEWLGWNPQHETWEAWDDPRADYPGSPEDVLDPAGFTDPAPVVIQDLTTFAETIEIDDQLDSSTDTWVDYGPDSPDVLPDTDYAPPIGDLDF